MRTSLTRLLLAAWLAACLTLGVALAPVPARADPGSAVALALWSASIISGSTAFAVTAAVVNFAVGLAISTAVSYLAKASGLFDAGGKPGSVGVEIRLQAGGEVPRSFLFGADAATEGSLAYGNTHSNTAEVGNIFLVQVIVLSDLPISGVVGLFVDGEAKTWDEDTPHSTLATETEGWGTPIPEYKYTDPDYAQFGELDYLWVKVLDGTQVAADPYLRQYFGSHPEYPVDDMFIGAGCALMFVTARYNPELFNGYPRVRLVCQGAKFYDPRADSTAGGAGAQRFADPSTWALTGNPKVVAYNMLRGISAPAAAGGEWLYGLQAASAAQLPYADWAAAMTECDTLVDKKGGGQETQFAASGEVPVSTPVIDAIDALKVSCNGRIHEYGGVYKPKVGPIGASVFSFTDDAILTDDPSAFEPFRSLADTVNGVKATYRAPESAYERHDLPPRINATLEAADGNRRLLASVAYDFVTNFRQGQRLTKAELATARRDRQHRLPMPQDAIVLEPGDVVDWTSSRNGYAAKLFEVIEPTLGGNLSCALPLREADPSDYDWTPDDDEEPVAPQPIIIAPPESYPVSGFDADAVIVTGDDGKKRVALRATWTANPTRDIRAIRFQVRKDATTTPVWRDTSRDPGDGTHDIFPGVLRNTDYEVRAQYVAKSDRATPWTSWVDVSTGDDSEPIPIIDIDHLDPDIQADYNRIKDASEAFFGEAIDNLANWVEELSGLVAENGAYIKTTEDAIIASVGKRTQEASAAIVDLKRVTVEEGLARAEAVLLLTAGLTDVAGQQSATAQLLDEQIVEIKKNTDGISAVASRTTAIETLVNDGEKGNNALAGFVETNTASINTNKDGIESLVNSTKDLKSRVDVLDDPVTGIVTGLATNYEDLETRVSVNEGKLEVESLRDTLLNAEYLEFQAKHVWEGATELLEFAAGIKGTLSSGNNDTLRLTATGTNAWIRFNLSASTKFNGNTNKVVRAVGRWRGSAVDFRGRLQYRTAGHGYTSGFYKDAPNPFGAGNDVVVDQFVSLVWDMSTLTEGANDWTSNQITGIRIGPSTSADAQFELLWIGWGQEIPAAISAVLESDRAFVTKTKDGVESIASSLKALIADTDYGYAEGLIAFESISAPTGVTSRVAIKAKTNIDDVLTEVGLYLDVINATTARITMKAEELVFVDNSLAKETIPFFYSGGKLYIKSALITDLTADNIKVKSLKADEILVDNTVITDLLEDFATASWASDVVTSAVNITTASTYFQVAVVTDVKHKNKADIAEITGMVDIAMAVNATGVETWTIEIRKNGSAMVTYVEYVASPQSTGTVRKPLMIGAIDTDPGNLPEYDIRVARSGTVSTASTTIQPGSYLRVQGWKK